MELQNGQYRAEPTHVGRCIDYVPDILWDEDIVRTSREREEVQRKLHSPLRKGHKVTDRKRANARGLAELGGKFAWILHPDAMQDLLSDSTITTSFERGAPRDLDEQAEFLGYVGSWGGFTFVETTNARIYASAGASGADVYANLLVARDAYAITELGPEGLQTYYQPRGSSGAISDPLHQVGSIGWKTTFTAAILNQAWLLRLESGATP